LVLEEQVLAVMEIMEQIQSLVQSQQLVVVAEVDTVMSV
tara:strand:- start:414 stop:530 length:117 start_codon:yes stop_codon:yes gene_type:complete